MIHVMTSFLIWRELFPCGLESHTFPIPACDMLVPIEYSLWNTLKGGSDTVTGFAWNGLSILPIKSPQTAVTARFSLPMPFYFIKQGRRSQWQRSSTSIKTLSNLSVSRITSDTHFIKRSTSSQGVLLKWHRRRLVTAHPVVLPAAHHLLSNRVRLDTTPALQKRGTQLITLSLGLLVQLVLHRFSEVRQTHAWRSTTTIRSTHGVPRNVRGAQYKSSSPRVGRLEAILVVSK